MHRVSWIAAALIVLAAPLVARAEGPFELTLSGQGSSDNDFDGTTLTGELGLGVHLGPVVLGARQSISYTDPVSETVDDIVSGTTRGFADLEIKIGRFAPFIGGNVGYTYGDFVNDQWVAGPEAGLKIYVGDKHEAFIFVRVEYQFFFEDTDDADEAFEDGQWVYGLGIGLRF